jgi:hypothetical protein
MHLLSFELALLTNIGKVSTCHSERRKTKKEERWSVIIDVLAGGGSTKKHKYWIFLSEQLSGVTKQRLTSLSI